jgi:hypothetical protein
MDVGDLLATLREIHTLLREIQDLLNPVTWVQHAVEAGIGPLADSFRGYVLSTGDEAHPFTAIPAIGRFEPLVRAAANAGLAGTVVWGSYRIMWARGFRSLYTVRAMLPRLLLGVILVNFSLPLVQAAVDSSNAISKTIIGFGIAVDWQGLFGDMSRDAYSGPGLTLVTVAALFCGYLVLAFAYIVRYALLVILAITAPLAGLLFVLPDTHHYAREWMSLFVSALLMQPLQLLILSIGFSLEAAGNWPTRHVMALGALYLAFKVPGALHSSSGAGRESWRSAKRIGMRVLKKGL